jgi:methylmalonyl-CoA mutase
VLLDLAGIVLDAGPETNAAARGLFALAAERGVPGSALTGNLGADPLGWQARTGTAAAFDVVELANLVAAEYPGLRAVTVDATAYHDAGGSDAEELGCAVATGVAYLRALTDAGLDTAAALGQLEFRYAANADQFLTIAKLRAARRLWARVAQVCGAPAAGAQRQHAVTSAAMMTARDPWVNMLRTTLACFAAGVGGADAVTVRPFDTSLGRPDPFARRIARNTHSLLMEEAHVARVTDPAGGSEYVERLTEELAAHAWAWFTEIERAGGMAAALTDGLVADRLAATWAVREANLARRRDAITGVSEFANPTERLPSRTPPPPPVQGGLPRHRYAEAFEALRDSADARADTTGVRPAVFLANLGPLAAHTGRTSFAGNLFAAGGIANIPSPSDLDPGRLAAAFTASGTTVACLCGTDKLYRQQAARVAGALRAAGATKVWLAGAPGDYDGVDAYLYPGCDAVDVLATTLRDLGVGR